MNLAESIRVALRSMGVNKMRASLTMLGVTIGVAAVIALLSMGQGVQQSIAARIRAVGTNLVFITPVTQSPAAAAVRAAAPAPTLTVDDAQAILESGRVPEAIAVAPEAFIGQQVIAGGQNTFTRVSGVTPAFASVRNFRVAQGTFVTREHVDSRALVGVLGSHTKQTLFGRGNAIGQTIRINQNNFVVVGVLESKGVQAQGNLDDVVFVPLPTMQTRLNRTRPVRGSLGVSMINVQLTDDRLETAQLAAEKIGQLLRDRHQVTKDDFTVRSQQDLLVTANQVTGFITLFLGAVASLSLLIGGIGIMNIMLVSVTERTREIGIRKAIGAKRRNILLQFLMEASVVSVIGGVVGILIGVGGSRLLDGIRFGGAQAEPLQTIITPDSILLAFSVSVMVGLVFGMYPALRASRLSPIEALRHE